MAGEKLVKLEKKQRRAAVLGKIFLILGALGLGICWVYGSSLYGAGRTGHRYPITDAVRDVADLARREPVGGVIALVSLVFLIFGLFLLQKSGRRPKE